jgi:dTDP-glucose pyrophosphorylase/CBS domain-containing protein
MPPERSLDIDSEESFEFAEFLLAKRYAELTDRNRIARYLVREDTSIRNAVRILDRGQIGFIAVVDENDRVVGLVTYREFRQAVLAGISLEKPVAAILNRQYDHLEESFTEKDVLRCFQNPAVEAIPVLSHGKLKEVVTRPSAIQDRGTIWSNRNPGVPVVIMAGGKGTRLDPFTRILPKPLIPINEKPLIEIIMDEFARCGAKDFYISINHKANIIKAYFDDSPAGYHISYLEEDKPLGTAGVLRYMMDKTDKPFFVSNCDIIVKADYSEIYDFHCRGGYDLTVVASMQHHVIPYGVCAIENGGELKAIEEKPQYDLLVNTGMYVLEPSALRLIPENQYYHITHLITDLKAHGGKIGVYPVSEQAWFDVGQWEEYRKNLKILMPDIRH